MGFLILHKIIFHAKLYYKIILNIRFELMTFNIKAR